MNEQAAIAAIRAGSIEGLKALYDSHASVLLNQAFRLLQSHAAAEDAVHDLFIRLPAMLFGFRSESSLRTWLYRCMHHHCLSVLNQNALRTRILMKTEVREQINQLNLAQSQNENVHTIRYKLEEAEVSDRLQQALMQLPAETRSLLWLKEAEGLPLKDLAYVMGIPEGTLKARLSRARAQLRRILTAEDIHGLYDL